MMFDVFFVGFGSMFTLMFIFVFVFMAVVLVKGISTWNKNNHSPKLTVEAVVTARRTQISHRNHEEFMHTSTNYFITFEVESGDRMEFSLSGSEYGMLVEGDRGRLTFQGTRYLGFERI